MNLLLIFIVLNILNVIIQTYKSLITIKSGKLAAAIWNAIAYGFYTIVLIYMSCDLNLYLKALIVGSCNLIGVYVVKVIEEKQEKEKLWKVELFGSTSKINSISLVLNGNSIKYSIISSNDNNYKYINIYCYTKKQSEVVKDIATFYNVRYFASEGKIL